LLEYRETKFSSHLHAGRRDLWVLLRRFLTGRKRRESSGEHADSQSKPLLHP
jgi:hypothetical protein